LQQAGSSTSNGISGSFEIFEYPAGPEVPSLSLSSEWASDEESGSEVTDEQLSSVVVGDVEARLRVEFDRRLAEETHRSFEAGREQGRQAEREAQAASQAAAERERVQQVAGLIESFTLERDRYLRAVEDEVVKLALAVAARILRREAQMDPLLLTGAVRVALGQLSGSTQVRLRVPTTELDLWTEAIGLVPNLTVKPVVIAGEGMRLGDCVIETELGSVDLGIRSQLGEIERGFFDRAGSSASGNSRVEATEPTGSFTGRARESRS